MKKLNPSEPVVSANAAPSARKARIKTTEKAAAKHSKAVVEEPVATPQLVSPSIVPPVVAVSAVETPVAAVKPVSAAKTVSTEDIAKLAYSFWAERGYQGGNSDEDWVRAEKTLRSFT